MSRFYVDASAFLKLVLAEAESAAVTALLGEAFLVSSWLLVTEARRAVQREHPGVAAHVDALLGPIALLSVDRATLERAARLPPARLRTLDAVHLASALLVADDLDGFVCYDARLADAAAGLGLRVLAPGNPETPSEV